MSLKLYRRKVGGVWHYRGTVDGCRLRGTTGTTDRKAAAKFAAQIETKQYEGNLFASKASLTFPQAVSLYLKAGKSDQYLDKLEDHWKNTRISKMTPGAIRQSAVDLYPGCSGATWNRQVITPTRAIINHCAELELCAPIRIKKYKFQSKVKKPVTLEWLNTFTAYARPMIKALVLQMFATAERFCEAHATEWSDYDFSQRTILFRDTKTGQESFCNMPQPLLIALANLPREKDHLGREKRPFFWSETELRRQWDEDIKQTAKAVPGFERLTFHSCRHGFATKLLRDGVDPKTAASLGHWKSVALFIETYAHAIQDPKITERLFDTPVARETNTIEQKQEVIKK
jgi:integrase